MSDNARKKQILLVDDDNTFRKVTKRLLVQSKFEVIEAEDGKAALNLGAKLNEINLIISDIKMPNLNGIDFFFLLRQKYPQMPFILMTAFTDIERLNDAFNAGISDFLSKPFTKERLLRSVNVSMGIDTPVDLISTSNSQSSIFSEEISNEEKKSKIEEEKNYFSSDQEYFPLPIEEFVSGSSIKFPIYIRLSKSKFVNIGSEGEDIDHQRIEFLKKKRIHFLYLTSSDYQKYINFNLDLLPKVLSSEKIPEDRKINFIQHATSLLIEYSYDGIINEDIYSKCKLALERTLSLLCASDAIFKYIEKFSTQSEKLFRHSLGVSLIAGLIARAMGWQSSKVLFTVTVAGLFHDIGLIEIKDLIESTPLKELNADQLTSYKTHPTRSANMAAEIPGISDELVQIIHQHHEELGGSGYPQALSRTKIHPISRLIALCEEFCSITKGGDQKLSFYMSVGNAIEFLKAKENSYGSDYYEALKKIFKIGVAR